MLDQMLKVAQFVGQVSIPGMGQLTRATRSVDERILDWRTDWSVSTNHWLVPETPSLR